MYKQVLSILWEVVKIAIIPLCIWFLEKQIAKRDERREQENENNNNIQLLMMQRMDKLSEMTHLMAVKLHEKRIINGDLEELDRKYRVLDAEYDKEVKRLALLCKKG